MLITNLKNKFYNFVLLIVHRNEMSKMRNGGFIILAKQFTVENAKFHFKFNFQS